eukprot:2708756-Amphidinium_carterae.1
MSAARSSRALNCNKLNNDNTINNNAERVKHQNKHQQQQYQTATDGKQTAEPSKHSKKHLVARVEEGHGSDFFSVAWLG